MRTSALLLVLCVAAAAQSAVAQPPPPPQQQGGAPTPYVPPEVQAACAGDVQKLCAGIQPGGGRIIACLKQHKDQVSQQCKQAIVKARQSQNPQPSPQSPPPAGNTLH
jgi:Cysteine rich repeat